MRRLSGVLMAAVILVTGFAVARAEAQEADDLGLVGNRFRPLTRDELTPEQRAMVESLLAGPRNGLGGPFNVMLRSPEMGDLAQQLGAYARFSPVLPANLREVAIIATAAFWKAEFEWYAHARAAIAAGVDAGAVSAIASGRAPEGLTSDEQVVYDFATELLETRFVGDATFEAIRDLLGEQGVVDVVATVGYYGLVSMLLNVDEYPLPEGVEPVFAED